MSSGIFIIQADGHLVEMSEQPYDSESLLQELLAKYPNLLAGDQINNLNPRRWLLISREAALPAEEDGPNRWSVDHLFLDQDGIPTLVEVKQSSNTDVRRKVVGQTLDYAANAVVYWPVEEIRKLFAQTCEAQALDPDLTLKEFLGTSENPDEFWLKVEKNLSDGKLRMLFVADKIPAELRRIVEYLNGQMSPTEVLAIEIKQFTGESLTSLIPRVIGQTEAASYKKDKNAVPGRQWDETSFFEELESRRGKEESEIARKIFEWARDKLPSFWWGNGRYDGSFVPILDHKGISYYPIAIWTYGKIEVQFQWLRSRPPFDNQSKRMEFLEKLNQIQGISIPSDRIDRRPSIPLSTFRDDSAFEQLIEALDWAVQEIRSS